MLINSHSFQFSNHRWILEVRCNQQEKHQHQLQPQLQQQHESKKKMEQFMDKVKPAESKKLNKSTAEFFYGCNIPFNVANSIYYKNFVKALRPAYNPPHRRLLAGTLLDETYDTMQKRNMELINKMDKQVTLLVDGWQNSSANRHYVVMMLSTSDDQKVFLESYDFSSIRETGENLHEAVQKAIALAKQLYDAEVYAILSDNAYNMQNMGAAARRMNLLYSTCNSHTANLLAGDVLKTTKYSKIMDKIMLVQKEFKKVGLQDRLLKAGGNKPILSCTTRWTSQRGAALSFIKNLSAMKTVTGKKHLNCLRCIFVCFIQFSMRIHISIGFILFFFYVLIYSCVCC